mgnify:CR=1 FL=1|tara:strand:- start:38 stop:751 length:714 start_codon:yes stop_codon:yes gene_type:complete
MKIGNKITAKNASWTFDKNVPKNFSKHIKNSIPFYNEGHNICLQLSDFFLKEKSNCYDLGCSTGTLLNKLSSRNDKNINFVGIDSIKKMIVQAKKENKIKKNSNKITYVNGDFLKIKLKKTDLITSYYTIQFIPPKFRQDILNKVFKSLNWGGAFIMFEKIRASDARFQDIFSITYNDFKLKNNFSPKEIIYKTKSLKGIMEPFSDFGNLSLIKRAGFKDVIPVFQWLCFKGYLCIK